MGKVKKKAPKVQASPREPSPEPEEAYDYGQYKEGVFGEGDIAPEPELPPSPAPEKLESPPSLSANGISSPVLSALEDDEDAGFDTKAWARNIPYGLSPPNVAPSTRGSPANNPAIAGALGTSPSGPAFSLAGSPLGTNNDRHRPPPSEDFRGGFAGTSPGMSPRPGQHRMPSRQTPDIHLAQSPRGRPLSIPSNYVPPSIPSQRPQAHLRGLSEAEIGMIHSRSTSGVRDGQDLVVFDQAFYDGSMGDAILVGSGQSLHVYRLDRDKLTILGTLDGLRGSVIAARMLPPSGEKYIEPRVVLIVHGPAILDPSEAPGQAQLSQHEAQTSVEVYSIKASRHIATLYRTPSVAPGHNIKLTDGSHAIGSLAVQVAGRFLTVTSGSSGEVYIFEAKEAGEEQVFNCLGKTWTSMPNNRQRSYSMSSASSAATTNRDESPGTAVAQQTGIVSLSPRWLAFVPPPASSQTSVHGEVGVGNASGREPPGLMAHTSPAQPSSNCEAETPLEDHIMNKFARGGYQEMVKGTRWATEQGIKAFRSYWNKPDAPSQSDINAYNASYGQQASSFPPTHAQDGNTRAKSTQTHVSVIDLERLSESNNVRPDTMIHPIATFPVRYGCSFLSFNPTGLSLFTASTKGDVFYVWCLMRMIHGNIATPQGDVAAADSHASVRQIARFARMSESNTIDVVWTKPRGEKLAILSERGTVHIHDLPASAFRWPPPALHASPASTPGITSESSSQHSQPKGRFGNAMSYLSSTAQTVQAATKYRPSFSGASFGSMAAAAGVRGGRMVAAGFSKSLNTASGVASNLLHDGESRTRLPDYHKARIVSGSVSLLSSKYQDALAITGNNIVRLHAIRLGVSDGGKGKRSVAGEQISQLAVPKNEGQSHPGDGLIVRGQWFADTKSYGFRANQPQPQPLSFAEIETSTPYKPFHDDHRISMNTYADDAAFEREGLEDWEFGEDIETREVGEEELPAGSMHLNKQDIDLDFEAHLDMKEEMPSQPAPPPPAAAAKPIKAKKGKKPRRTEPRQDDSIDVHDEELAPPPSARHRAEHEVLDDDFDDEADFPFGRSSEFDDM